MEGLNSTSATSAYGPDVEFSVTVASLATIFGGLGFLGFLAATFSAGTTSGVELSDIISCDVGHHNHLWG